MPPIANHGTVSVSRCGAEEVETARDRILLRRRRERGDADVVGAGDVVELVRRRDGEPEQPIGPTSARASSTDMSLRPTWTPSAPHASTRSGRSLRTKSAPCAVARRTERLGRSDERLVVELLVAELDDVHAAAQRRVRERGVAASKDEVEPRAGKPCRVHGGHA